ncbi:MAG: hypothetical protein KAJ88_00900 [Candidatus Aenigmarchaeota archaeon]|nr:hypothetical protein [Candidatus Aenigmarchaeota archaeon]
MIKSNPLEECLGIEYKDDTLSTGGHRYRTGIPPQDVCYLGRKPDEEAYKQFCKAFIGDKKRGIPAIEPGAFRYIPELNTWAHIPNPYRSIEQNMNTIVKGSHSTDLTKEKDSGKTVKDSFRIDSGGHPDQFGMLNQHNRRDKNGRAIFNAVYDENGNFIEDESYTPRQMRKARIPVKGEHLTILYPEAYERAFDEPSKAEEVKKITGYESIDEASWLKLKEYNGLEWSLGKISSNKRIVEFPGAGEPFYKKSFNRAESTVIITILKDGKENVGAGAGDTAIGNLYQHWDLEALKKIPGGYETAQQIKDEVIETRPENLEGLQIALGTVIGRKAGMTPPYGHALEVTGIIEYNYLTDNPYTKWGIQ